MPLSPGARLGPYEVLSLIGAGGMAEVYKAYDPRLDRPVAIKIMRSAVIREARAASSVEHPNIVAIHDVMTAADRCCIVMQYVEGLTLRQMLDRRRIAFVDAVRYAVQIADALGCAHAHGIVHRDLTPDNIMITTEGSVRILDFGIAMRQQPDPVGDLPTTESNIEDQIVGTPAYMSPEQVRGELVDRSSDIWSFGCVLFEMLSGRRAFGGATAIETAIAVAGQDPDWSTLPTDVPVRVRDLIKRCLQRQLSHRLHDVIDARIELEESLESSACR